MECGAVTTGYFPTILLCRGYGDDVDKEAEFFHRSQTTNAPPSRGRRQGEIRSGETAETP